ncbi:MAG TPA: PQQ-binding-like beta-propeller repeat protein, partial [Xanthomonadales bacterium]|nr:PQQ-binding-like beta-propeller repeat protein [Xanthomonadales bacterium]
MKNVTGWMVILLLVCACDKAQQPAPGDSAQQADSTGPAVAEAAHPGEAAYLEHCAGCHDQAMYKAPSRVFLAMMGPRNVLASLQDGLMSQQAAALDSGTREAIAEYLTGQSLDNYQEPAAPPSCDAAHQFDPGQPPVSTGWGTDLVLSRFQPAASAGLSRQDLGQMEVKWAFAYPNSIKARSQPVFGGGAIYFGADDGKVRALDAKTGCLRWAFQAAAEVRNAPVISPWSAEEEAVSPSLYFGDILGRVYALDARSGELLWKTKVDEHPDATLTAAAALHDGRLYVPVSSLEVVSAANPAYECCTFRGAIVALDAADGTILWKSWSIDQEPAEAGTTATGTRVLAPSGAPFWNTPVIDVRRNRLYLGSGENYSSPADGNSDALIAYDLDSGEKLWVSQQTGQDAWNVACLMEDEAGRANCPHEDGPDYDFASSPMLVSLADGREVLIGGQKSGSVVAVNPDTGETLWKVQVGRGGIQGGVHFGMAAEGTRVYVPINDMTYPVDALRYDDTDTVRPGLYAIDASSGEMLWSTPAADLCQDLVDCDPGISQAVTAIPGAVIA